MVHRLFPRSALIAVLLLLIALPALAGGWAVVTLDELPSQVIAGEPLTIGFVVRQHGQRPVDGLTPTITAIHAESNESFSVTARQEGATGHYVATLTFPKAGAWRWGINAFTFEQPMPTLTVLPAAPASGAEAAGPVAPPLAVGIVALIAAAGALLVARRTGARYAPALALIAVAIGVTGFAWTLNRPAASAPQPARVELAQRGQELFLAKGCIVCHRHAAVREARKAFASFSIGPELTNWSADPEFLRRWLKNPVAVRPATQMPTLGLSDDEIEALVAFLVTNEPTTPPTLLLVDPDEGARGLRARRVDPVALADLSDPEPLPFGHHYSRTVSPDGRTLALITWPSGSHNRGGVLHLIDLSSWAESVADLSFDDYVDGLTFTADGRALYWAGPTREDPAHGMPRDYELYHYEIASGKLTVVAKFSPSFIPWWSETRLLRPGSHLAIYGIPIDAFALAEDAPHVLIVDLATGEIAADVRLDGVTAGQLKVKTAGTGENPYRAYTPGLAWDLERDRLYVVHADRDAVTVIDLVTGKILKEAEVLPRRSLLERLWHWLIPAVEAKMVPGTQRRAVLSPDGKRLYVVGLSSEMTKRADGNWEWRETPLGLQVIATNDLSELRRIDLPASDVALSPDGRRLLLIGARLEESDGTRVNNQHNGLYVLDAGRLETLAHLRPDVTYFLHGFSPDSRYAYLSYGVSGPESDWTVVLQVLDLESLQIVGERKVRGYGELVPGAG